MAPLPDDSNPDDHYDAGAPLDGGASPAILGNGDKHFSPTGMEIGVIVGVVALVIITVVGLFVWRSRKNRDAKVTDAASSVPAAGPYEELPTPPGAVHARREAGEPTPPPRMATPSPSRTMTSPPSSSLHPPPPTAPLTSGAIGVLFAVPVIVIMVSY
ncbi:hypothetical protein ABKA04_007333 [Annulohypoxylon sp. FPYF3050]